MGTFEPGDFALTLGLGRTLGDEAMCSHGSFVCELCKPEDFGSETEPWQGPCRRSQWSPGSLEHIGLLTSDLEYPADKRISKNIGTFRFGTSTPTPGLGRAIGGEPGDTWKLRVAV